MADQTPPPPDTPDPTPAPAPGTPPPPPAYPGAAPGTPQQYGPAPQNGMGTAALVMGILQFVCLGPIASILAIVFGAIGRKKAKQGLATNGGVATAGFWLGIVGIILSVIGGIIFAAIVVFGVNAASEALDPANNRNTGLSDGYYSMEPNTWIYIGDRCSYGGTPTNSDGQVASSSVTVVGEGGLQCPSREGDYGSRPGTVEFTVTGGVAEITEVR